MFINRTQIQEWIQETFEVGIHKVCFQLNFPVVTVDKGQNLRVCGLHKWLLEIPLLPVIKKGLLVQRKVFIWCSFYHKWLILPLFCLIEMCVDFVNIKHVACSSLLNVPFSCFVFYCIKYVLRNWIHSFLDNIWQLFYSCIQKVNN